MRPSSSRRRVRLLRPAVACLAALCLLAGSASGDFDEEENRFPNEAYPAALRQRVNEALDRSAHYLLRRQQPNGAWTSNYDNSYPMGATALALLAALKAGVPPNHPRIELGFRYLRGLPLQRTYSVGILLMALDARYGKARDAFEEEEVDRYGNRRAKEPCAEHIPPEDLEWMKEGVEFLTNRQDHGTWRYPGGGHDLSNTQYALLGLKAAVRCGVRVRRRVWEDALEALLEWQDEDGEEIDVRVNEVRGDYRIEWTEHAKARGFRYMEEGGPPTSGSMTTAGIAGLLICQSELWSSRSFTGKQRQRTRDAVRDAFAWMQRNFAVDYNPRMPGPWDLYYLYGLERAGILARTRFIGEHDWYLEGAEYLLPAQSVTGSWWQGDVVNTCFAILFLKRASFRTANPAITEPDGPAKSPGTTAPGGGR